MKKHILACAITLFIVTNNTQGASIYFWVEKAIAPLQAGYGYTQEQKAKAKEIIDQLEQEKEQIMLSLNSSNKFRHLHNRLKEIDIEIHKQKIIIGQSWSRQRKIVVSLLTLSGAVISFCAYKYFYPTLSYLELIALRKKELQKIQDNYWIEDKNAQKKKKNPNYEIEKIKAEKALDDALKKTPFNIPDLVPLDDIEALKKRRDFIAKQREVLDYQNPNFDPAIYKAADQHYKDSLKDPRNIAKLEEKFEQKMQDSNFRTKWVCDRWSIEKDLIDIANDIRRIVPYKAPAFVDEHDLEGLKQRLETIRLKRWLCIGSEEYNLLNYYDENQARQDYRKAFEQYKNEYALRVPYHSPDLVDPNDTKALKKRMHKIRKQKSIKVDYQWLKKEHSDEFCSVESPNYNESDYNAAEKAHKLAVLRNRLEGVEWTQAEWSEYWNMVHRLTPKQLFKVAHHIGSYKDSAHYLGILYDASKAFQKLDKDTQLKLLSKMSPYCAPSTVDSNNIKALYDRYQDIEEQQHIEYEGTMYPNMSFNKSDLEDAWNDYWYAYQNAYHVEQERLANQGLFDWAYEKVFGK